MTSLVKQQGVVPHVVAYGACEHTWSHQRLRKGISGVCEKECKLDRFQLCVMNKHKGEQNVSVVHIRAHERSYEVAGRLS